MVTRRFTAAAFLALNLQLTAQGPGGGAVPIPPGLIDDPHVREELAVNEFTAPSIAKIFDSLETLAPLPLADYPRLIPDQPPLNRADLAVELGFLIADGFLVVQAGELNKVEELAAHLNHYGKLLGVGDRVTQHAAGLLDNAKKEQVDQMKMELRATQKDVEKDLVDLRDADLAHLISLGGWIRALQVSSGAVDRQFSEERARTMLREDIADYYASILGSLEPRIAERPNFIELRELLTTMQQEMLLPEGVEPTREQVAGIHKQASRCVELALKREDTP